MDKRTGGLPLPASVLATLVEHEMTGGSRWLRFAPDLEHLFEEETRPRQIRHMLLTAYVGIALFNLFLLADYLLVPDVFVLAVLVRLAIVTPLSLVLVLLFIRYARSPVMRHSTSIIVMMIMSLASIYLLAESSTPERVVYHQGVLLIVIFVCLIHRPRFWYGVVGAVVTNILFSIGLHSQSAGTLETRMAIELIVVMGSLFAIVASYSMEREQRLFYLISLKERLHSMLMEGISNRDALTGLSNRRALDRRLLDLNEHGAGWHESLAVIILDIDHFKIYNDRLGHQAGDDCLKRVASLLQSMMREGRDEAFRYGGEEFLLLVSESDRDRAIAFAETVRRAIEAEHIPHPESSTGPYVTASLGVAQADALRATPLEVIARADMALYAAKNGGRNRVWPQLTLRSPVREVIG